MKDNYDLFLEWDYEKERDWEKLPQCDVCEDRIDDPYYYDIHGKKYCQRCLNEEFRVEMKWFE